MITQTKEQYTSPMCEELDVRFEGILGLYWSSSLHDTNSRQAFDVEFDGLVVRKSSQTRETGSFVRPVSD